MHLMKLINKLQRLHVNQKETKLARKPFFILQSLQTLTKRQSLNNLSFLQNFPTQCKITLIKSPNEGQRGLSKLDKKSEGCIFYYIHVYLVAQTKVNTIPQRTGESCIFSLSPRTSLPSLPTQKSWQLKEKQRSLTTTRHWFQIRSCQKRFNSIPCSPKRIMKVPPIDTEPHSRYSQIP